MRSITTVIGFATLLVSGCGGGGGSTPKPSPQATATRDASKPAATADSSSADSSKPEASASGEAGWGTLKGRFIFDGPRPEAEKVNVTRDEEVFGKLGIVDESLLVDSEGGLANVVIYVRTKNPPVHPDVVASTPPTVTIDNKGGRFTPHIVPLWHGKQTLVIGNPDPVAHNSNMQPLGDSGTNPLIAAGSKAEYSFGKPQNLPVPVSCNIHPWMKGYVLPRDNPYVAVSGSDGFFKLELPAGELEFIVWHEKTGYLDTPVSPKGRMTHTIKPGANDLGTIKVNPQQFNK